MDSQSQDVLLKIENLSKKFGRTNVLNGISMEIRKHEIIGIVGSSGCGKSTLLQTIAGMLAPDGGKILMNGNVISEECNVLPPEKRRMYFVPQDFALCDHKNVYENIVSGVKKRWFKNEVDEARAQELLKLLHLEGLENRYPAELSAGQRQRTAIAGALMKKPDVLLLDEPLASFDIQLRMEMRAEMAQIFRKLGITVICVWQDPAEACAVSDRIVIMNHGQIEQMDSPQNCYTNPKTETAAALLGVGNRVHGYAREDGAAKIDLGGGVCRTLGRTGIRKDDMVTVRFRAENAVWTGDKREKNSFPVAVEYSLFEGDHYRVMAKMGMGERLCFVSRTYLEKGAEGFVSVEDDRIYVYAAGSAA